MSDRNFEHLSNASPPEEQGLDVSIEKLKEAILAYLDTRVKEPALQTVDRELTVQQDIISILGIYKVTEELILDHGSDIDTQSLYSLSREDLQNTVDILRPFIAQPDDTDLSAIANPIIDKYLNKKHLFAYLGREINWIAVSLLSASYISSMILIRSMFELLIGIATNTTGGMSDRIESITYMTENEHEAIRKSWNKLNAWTHPYGKWEKEVCPVFVSHKPLYHPTLYQIGITEFRMLADMFLVITIEKFAIPAAEIMNAMKERSLDQITDLEKFVFFIERLRKT